VKIAVLVSDPERGGACRVEQVSHNVKTKFFMGVGHWIQYECLDAIMDEVPLPRAKL
jgi:hypothetical protein